MTSKPKPSPKAKFPFTIPVAYIVLFLVLAAALNALFYLVLSIDQHRRPAFPTNSLTATFFALHTATPSQTPFRPGPTSTITPTVTPTLPPTATREPTPTETPQPTETLDAFGLPGSARVAGFIGHAQFYNLDCESRSAVDFARYFGNDLVETTFLNDLPLSDDPNKGFVGSYNDPVGQIPPDSYGVYAGPIADLLSGLGTPAKAEFGFTWDQVREEIANGRPVITWVIFGIAEGTPIDYVVPSDGNTVVVAHYEHTVIVIGYTPDRVTVMDGASRYSVSLSQFLNSWSVLGNMAVIAQ